MALIDLDTVKTYLGITGTDDDAYLQQQIDAASAMVESYCGREFDRVTDQEQVIEEPTQHVMLTRFPLHSITTITDVDGNEFNSDAFYFDARSGWLRWAYDGLKWQATDKITVTYDGGYDDIPKDLETVLLDMVATRYYQRGQDMSRPVRSETTDGIGSFTYAVDSSFFGGGAGSGGFGNWPIHQYAGVLDLYRIETVLGI